MTHDIGRCQFCSEVFDFCECDNMPPKASTRLGQQYLEMAKNRMDKAHDRIKELEAEVERLQEKAEDRAREIERDKVTEELRGYLHQQGVLPLTGPKYQELEAQLAECLRVMEEFPECINKVCGRFTTISDDKALNWWARAQKALSTITPKARKIAAVVEKALAHVNCESEIHDGKMCACSIALEDAVEAYKEEA